VVNSSKPKSVTDQQPELLRQRSWKDDEIRHVSSSAIALFTVILMVIFMPRSTQQTSERARVTVQDATIVGPLIQHNVPRATILFQNNGCSPALSTSIRLGTTVWNSNKSPDRPPPLATDVEHVGEIGPGSVVSQAVSLRSPLTDVQGIHLERKDWVIMTFGVVSYFDIFGKSHETNLCFIWRDTSQERMSPCEKWSDAD